MAEDFGAFITSRRRQLELTLGDVASGLSVSPVTVSNWSTGKSIPDSDQLAALAELLKVPADDLSKMASGTSGTSTQAVKASVDDEVEIPEPDPPTRASQIDDELAEMIEEASAEIPVPDVPVPDVEVPAFVEPATPTPRKAPAPAAAPARSRQRSSTVTAERPVTTLPLTYIEDPKQLMRYRLRWTLTVIAMVVMFFILLWAAAGLISALSDIKESVTPGGGS